MRFTSRSQFTSFKVEDLTPLTHPEHPFVAIDLIDETGAARLNIFLHHAGEADELITAACEAKRLLLGQPADVTGEHPYPVTAAACTRGEHAACVLSACACQCHTTLPQRAARSVARITGGKREIEEGEPEAQCLSAAVHPGRPEGVRLFCWLPKGHDGPHYDQVDQVSWELVPAAHVDPCPDAKCDRAKGHHLPHRDLTGKEWASSADNHAETAADGAA